MYIYKITNIINKKVYIGQSFNPIEKRFHRHISDAMNNVLDTHLARAIRKYGPENFIIELIDTAVTQDELTQKEHDWTVFYNAVEDGYNETDATNKCGGNTYKNKTIEELEIIKNKIRQTKIGGKNPNASKIKCKNLETDQEYFFNSMSEAAQFFNQSGHQFISRRCRGEIKNLYQGKWAFAYQDQDYNDFTNIPNAARAKQVEVINLQTNKKNIFNTCNDADRYCGFSIGYTSKKFKKIQQSSFERNQYKLTLLK